MVLAAFFAGNTTTDSQATEAGATLYEVWHCMKNEAGCTYSLDLDGSGSTRISYKQGSQKHYVDSFDLRLVHCRIRVTY